MTLGGTVAVVTGALVVASGVSCLSLLNDKFNVLGASPGGQSIVYKTESASESKSDKWETAATALASLSNSDIGSRAPAGGGKYRVASLQINDRFASGGSSAGESKSFPLHRFSDDTSVLTRGRSGG